jgi:hypothetical protein
MPGHIPSFAQLTVVCPADVLSRGSRGHRVAATEISIGDTERKRAD